MTWNIEKFDASGALDKEILECHGIITSSMAEDFPEHPMPDFSAYADALRAGCTPLGPQRLWVARECGRIVGYVSLVLPPLENEGLTMAAVWVSQDSRRRGVGTALLQVAARFTSEEQRGLITGQALKVGSNGERWALARGFAKVQEFVFQRLIASEVDAALWDLPTPPGFRIIRWMDRTPRALVSSYAAARAAIHDAPTGDSNFRFAEWTVERIRRHEDELREQGNELSVAVLLDEKTREIVALTEMLLMPNRPGLGFQMETVVIPSFRGNGFGRLVKAAMMRWLTAERTEVRDIMTSTAHDNIHMIRVNHQVGYRTMYAISDVEAAAAAVIARNC